MDTFENLTGRSYRHRCHQERVPKISTAIFSFKPTSYVGVTPQRSYWSFQAEPGFLSTSRISKDRLTQRAWLWKLRVREAWLHTAVSSGAGVFDDFRAEIRRSDSTQVLMIGWILLLAVKIVKRGELPTISMALVGHEWSSGFDFSLEDDILKFLSRHIVLRARPKKLP